MIINKGVYGVGIMCAYMGRGYCVICLVVILLVIWTSFICNGISNIKPALV